MKKFIAALVCLALMVCGSAFASGVDLSTMSEEELLALQAQIDEALAQRPDYSAYTDEELAREAIEVLKEYWRELYADMLERGSQTDGYLAIRSTRVLRVADLSGFEENSLIMSYLDGAEAIVEFLLYTDGWIVAPFYYADDFTVIFYSDGTVKTNICTLDFFRGAFEDYGVSAVFESITDFEAKFNEECYLVE